MEITWKTKGISEGFVRNLQGISLELLGESRGNHGEVVVNSCGISGGSIGESLRQTVENSWGINGKSLRNS